MNLDAFETFVQVARLGSFAAAARSSDCDPSIVSRQIAGLEKELGYRLFDRNTRRLALTEAGRVTFERVQGPLNDIREIPDIARSMVSQPSGQLRVTASLALGEHWLVPRLPAFQKQFPDIAFDLLLSDSRVDLVGEQIDLAIRLGQRVKGAYVASRLMMTRYRVVASAAYLAKRAPLNRPADIEHHNCIVFPFAGYRSLWRFRSSNGSTDEISVQGGITISSALAIRRAALEGMGVALMADWLIEDDMASGALIDLLPNHEVSAADFDTAAWVVYPTRDYVPTKTRVFIDYLRSTV